MSGGRVAPAIVYAAFAQTGGIYGPSFQGVTAIQQGTGELLASLRLPAIVQNTLGDYVLHPSVMDSALQGYYGLVEDWLHGSDQTRLPFALESLTVLAPCGPEMMAWMRYAPGIQAEAPVVKFDVDLCDPRGRVCVRLRGFAVRSLKPALPSAKKESQGSGQLVTLAPFWDALKPDAAEIRPRSGERVVMIGGDESRHAALRQICEQAEVLDIDRHTTVEELCGKLREGARIDHLIWILPSAQVRALKGDEGDEGDGIIADQEEGVLLGFRLIKALLREGYGAGELGWTVITRGTQRVGGRPEETVDATHGSVAGLVGSMAKEYRNWFVRLVDVSGEEWPWEAILRLPRDERGDGWAWREGQWYRRRLVEWQGGAREGAASGYRRGGVYVVIGGAGGVGQVLSEDLIRRYDARMVWIGRRERDEAIQQRQTLVSAGGGQPPLYIAADARSREELVRARQEIKERYGRIDGVIHSSIVLTDKSLANMSDEQFRAALSAKVDVAVRLAQVFGSDALDFMLYFSSLQTFLKAPGQGNYAAGCTFTDAFADWQSGDAGYPVKVMNWGYWGSVGVVAGQEYQERMARMGWGSIGPEEGMAGLERLLNGPIDQMGMIRVRGDEPARALGVIQGQCLSKAEQVAPSVSERLAEEVISLERAESLQELRSGEERRREWDALLVKMLRGQVERMGWKGEAPGAWSEEQWRQRTGLAGEYGRWWSESLRILARNGGAREDQVRAQGEELWWRAWEKEKSRFDEQGHGMRAQVKLVDAALRNMDAILRGSKRATDVLFPDSSLALVEGVYKNNPVSDHFNEVMADVVRCYVRARRREEGSVSPGLSLRLLELGAGTGGSSQRILQTLDGDRDAVVEYCYSDVSRWFLRHGEQEFGAGREYLTYAVVDVEKGLPEQGVECGAYDMVLAANVLHATHRLRETLRNAKAALKENGILVLNEIGTKSVSMHLTFGLLAGWWAYEDEELRMEGSPGVTAETWKRVLEEEGFRNVGFPARDAHRFGQQIVVAESDGIIRQVRDGAPHRPAAVTPHVLHVRPAVAAAPVPAPTESAALLPRVERWLMDAVGVLLKVRREDVDVDAELSEFGFDSISLTGFANHVNHAHGLDLMPTIFFEHPTIRRFARHLVQAHQARLEETFHAEPPRSSPVLPTLHTRRRADKGLLAEVEQWLVQAVGTLLKVRKEDVDLDAELSELGFDSISLTGLANHVNRAHALELMPTIFFEHPTVSRLARYLVEMHADRLNATLGLTSVDSPIAAKARRRESAEDTVGEGYASGPQTAAPARSHGNASRPMASGEEAIAIIGMSGRFPGADDLDRFWENLQAGKQSVMEVPRHRWDWRVVNEGRNGEGDTGAKWGAFIDGVDEFDPLFFGISPREAERIDPQHRLTMMYGWKAFEDAGYGPKQLWGSRTGVFIGTTNTGYGELLTQAGVGIEGFTATGLVPSVGPNRLSFFLNLHGPSEPIETACSSSLVAVHRAVRAIQAGDCEMALVGGVNTLFPTLHTSFYRAGMLSPDGKCKTFSSRADGYVRGEGVGMVVLKPRSAAERDGDHIYGLIRGSAENHGGRAQSLTAPNPQAQAELIKDAYRRAGFSPGSVSYIEAHGTGTSLGDPIEVNGLKSAFQSLFDERGEQPHSGYCGLGSVKSNIGHLELASGMAGLIKILLQLKHATLVPTLHCDEINPYIRLENSPFYIVKDSQPWTRSKDAEGREWPRRAGVSSFGFGGVNAHIVVEEYVAPPAMEREADRRDERDPFIVVLSARDPERLKEQAVLLRDAIGQGGFSDGDLAGMACTLQLGREAMDHRLGMKIESLRDLEQKLESFIEGKTQIAGLFLGAVERNSETLVLFRGDEELQEAVEKWIEKGKWSKLLELWVKGLEVDWEQLYGGEKPGRLSLPTYPFARERCWIDVPASPQDSSRGSAVLHPLLHTNTSDLTGQRYSSTFTGEEFFLTDHRVRMHGGEAQKVLPGVAYLEMARAAIERASAVRPEASVLELRNTVWLVPIVVTQRREISLALAATDDDQIAFDVHSVEAGQKTIHCQGRAIFRPQRTPVRLDLAQLDSQMQEARLTAADVYGVLTRMGLDYGPAHQGIANLRLGRNQLLAQLHIPAALRTTESDYVLHPALMDSALQAAVGLIVDLRRVPNHPPVPFVLDSLRLASPCGAEMFVWARHAEGSTGGDRLVRLDIDVCDPQGNVCVEMRGFSSQAMDGIPKVLHEDSHRMAIRPASAQETSAAFDDAHYLGLIADIVNHRVSVDEAVELEWESLLP